MSSSLFLPSAHPNGSDSVSDAGSINSQFSRFSRYGTDSIPSHHHQENFIAPALDASTQILTSSSTDLDDVDLVYNRRKSSVIGLNMALGRNPAGPNCMTGSTTNSLLSSPNPSIRERSPSSSFPFNSPSQSALGLSNFTFGQSPNINGGMQRTIDLRRSKSNLRDFHPHNLTHAHTTTGVTHSRDPSNLTQLEYNLSKKLSISQLQNIDNNIESATSPSSPARTPGLRPVLSFCSFADMCDNEGMGSGITTPRGLSFSNPQWRRDSTASSSLLKSQYFSQPVSSPHSAQSPKVVNSSTLRNQEFDNSTVKNESELPPDSLVRSATNESFSSSSLEKDVKLQSPTQSSKSLSPSDSGRKISIPPQTQQCINPSESISLTSSITSNSMFNYCTIPESKDELDSLEDNGFTVSCLGDTLRRHEGEIFGTRN